MPHALLMPIASWFGAGLLRRGARAITLATTLPIAVVLTARWPVLGCLIAALVIAALSAWATLRTRIETRDRTPRTEIVGGAAAALMLALVPALPTVIEIATASIALAILVHARPRSVRAIDQRFTKTAGDLALGVTMALLVAIERGLGA